MSKEIDEFDLDEVLDNLADSIQEILEPLDINFKEILALADKITSEMTTDQMLELINYIKDSIQQ